MLLLILKNDFLEISEFRFFSFSGVPGGFSRSRPLREGRGHPGESPAPNIVQIGPQESENGPQKPNYVNEY